jgi:hypothetical protein
MIQPGGSPWTQSSNNTRPDETVWMVDGVFNANFADRRPIVNSPSPFTDGATILPIDAIQEFNLEEDPKAEYGFSPGAVVNVGIKSGTNNLHGSAYAFGRDGTWDARNVFNPPPAPALPTQLEQFGGVVGGPIKKDKLFFFGGYEGLRSFVGNALGTSVPATATGLGPSNSMVDAILALQKAGVKVSPISKQLFGCPAGFDGFFNLHGQPHPKCPREHDDVQQRLPQHQQERQRRGEARLSHQRQAHDPRHSGNRQILWPWRRSPHRGRLLAEPVSTEVVHGHRRLDLDRLLQPGQ